MAKQIHQRVLILAFLAMIGTVGIAQALIDVSRGEPIQAFDLFRQSPSAPNLRRFEKELERHSWFAGTLRPVVAYRRFQVFDDVGSKVLLGRDGWWFFRAGAQYMVDRPLDDPEKQLGVREAVEAIVHFREQLAGHGIELVVMPVPNKASIYPDMLTSRLEGPVRADQTQRLLRALDDAGVRTIDLYALFAAMRAGPETADERLYLPRDTHWTPACARRAAEAVASRLMEWRLVDPGDVGYELRNVEVQRRGDVLKMLQLPQAEDAFPLMTITCTQVVHPGTGRPYEGDEDSPVLVLGDSFLNIYEQDDPTAAGFIAHLANALRRPLTAIVNDGGASTLVRQQVAMRPDVLEGKKLVVWEFVERDIRFGKEGWQRIPLTNEKKK